MKLENVKYIAEAFGALCSNFFLKCTASATYIFYAFVFNPRQQPAMLAILLLIVFDFITGFSAAKHTGEEIKSSKVLRTVIKIILYFLLISAGHLVQKTFGINLYLEETILAFLSVTELISILENIGRLGFAVPKKLLNKLESLRDSE